MGDGTTPTGEAQFVLARDQSDPAGELTRHRVTRTYLRTAYALQVLTLRDEDGNEQKLRVTEEHPFYVDRTGWTPAKSLAAGDILLGADSTLIVVRNDRESRPQGVTVYNLEVEQAHTYFVLAGDAAAVWAHNATYSRLSADVPASTLNMTRPATPEWSAAVKMLQSGKSSNIRVPSASVAKQLLAEGRGNMNRYTRYTSKRYSKGYEMHPSEHNSRNAPWNDLQHIKWKDWHTNRNPADGHIFFDKPN